jgi:hypothetical protein
MIVSANRILDDILRHLAIARVSQPMSKLATVDYPMSYYDEDVDLNSICHYMDKLYNTQMELAHQISIEHTRKILGGKVELMFYDMTTLYFETAKTDVLREPGFSEDGKTARAQVVLGLLVSDGGYPLSYSMFNGSQYEGFTMIPMIDDFRQRFTLGDDFVVLAHEQEKSPDAATGWLQVCYWCKNQERACKCQAMDAFLDQGGQQKLLVQAKEW